MKTLEHMVEEAADNSSFCSECGRDLAHGAHAPDCALSEVLEDGILE